jgi:hypothetical protein
MIYYLALTIGWRESKVQEMRRRKLSLGNIGLSSSLRSVFHDVTSERYLDLFWFSIDYINSKRDEKSETAIHPL